jgi:hypothetical protein
VTCPSGFTVPEKPAPVLLVAVGAPGTAAGGDGGGGLAADPGTSSKAPMSHLPPAGWGRATPRWSVGNAPPRMLVHDPASIAGLPARSA